MNESLIDKEGTAEEAVKLGLFPYEYDRICEKLGRTPTFTELAMFSGMWSEHCSYKNSILLLKTLYSKSDRLLAKPGEENAGALRLNDKQAVVFKIESHNHPSAVEPYQGAATGVGGIMRDIFTMGARPLVSLNSLRFGHPEKSRNRYLLRQVVKGIGDYGNSLGIPVAGGELFFHESFSKNPLVNAMTVGIASVESMASARARGPGNLVVYVGARTGRDGIHGASFASKELSNESAEERSAVQVGDPFMEKLVMEATLEVIQKKLVVSIQDMGAAGLVSSSSEMAASGGVGIDLHTDRIPAREANMQPFEFLLSESQERMLIVVEPTKYAELKAVFTKWELEAAEIGAVTDTGLLQIFHLGELYASVPASLLAKDAPRYEREVKEPVLPQAENHEIRDFANALSQKNEASAKDILTAILSHVNIASKKPLFRQYDTDIGLMRKIGPGQNSGVYRVPDSNQALSVTVDGNSFYISISPYEGVLHTVAEARRNIISSGATPIGITNGLNYANPFRPENYYFFESTIRAMSHAAETFKLPITGGNVSFYNESEDGPVLPTPMIGMVGLIENHEDALPATASPITALYLVGQFLPVLSASQYAWILRESQGGPLPQIDLAEEEKSGELILRANALKLLQGATDLSNGGAMIAALRMIFGGREVLRNSLGLTLHGSFAQSEGADKLLFGETAHTYLVAVTAGKESDLLTLAETQKVPLQKFADVTDNGSLTIGSIKMDVADLQKAWETGLEKYFR